MDVAALIISILALLAAGASARYSRQQAKGTAAQALEAKRANDRLDAIDAAEAQAAEAEAERQRVRWDLRHMGGKQWSLRNVGTEPARDITLSVTGAVLRADGADGNTLRISELRPHRPVSMTIVPTASWGSPGPPRLSIDWEGREEPELVDLPAV